MKLNNIKSWSKFNEMNSKTYYNAANKAYDYGRDDLGDRLVDHGDSVSNVDKEELAKKRAEDERKDREETFNKFRKSSEKFKNIPKINVFSGDFSSELTFSDFNIAMDIDIWNDTLSYNVEENIPIDELPIDLSFIDENAGELYEIQVNSQTNGVYLMDSKGENIGSDDGVKFDRKSARTFKKILEMFYSEMIKRGEDINEFDKWKEIFNDKVLNRSIHHFIK